MTINEFLDCFNATLKQDREAKGYESGAQFVFYQWYDKKHIGNYYEYHMKIEYVHTIGVINPFVSLNQVIQISGGPEEKEEAVEELHKAIITSFLTKVLQPGIYDQLISGVYGTE